MFHFIPFHPPLAICFPSSLAKVRSFELRVVLICFHLFTSPSYNQIFFSMRSTPIFVAALVGVASAGMPKWALQSSKTGGPGFEKPHSGDMFPSSGPENRYHQKYHNNPPFIFPSGGTGNPYHQKHHNNPLAISGGPGKPHYQKDHHRGPSPPTTATANSNISGK